MTNDDTTTRELNGIDLARLNGTISAVQEQPELAKFAFRTKNRWVHGGRSRSEVQGFYGVGGEDTSRRVPHLMDADEPTVLLGDDSAPNPGEYLLHALAACMTSSLVYHAAARGIVIESIESHLTGDIDLQGFLGLDESMTPGFQGIRAAFKVKSEATEEELSEMLRFSPNYHTIVRPVPVETSVEKAGG